MKGLTRQPETKTVLFDYLGKVVLMVLIGRLFVAALMIKVEHPVDVLYLGLAVLFVAVALHLQHLAHSKKPAHVAQHVMEEDGHSTGTAPTQTALSLHTHGVSLPLPPPPPMPSLAPTIAHPREHPLPQAHGSAYPPPPQPQPPSSMNPPPPAWSQLQHYPPRS